MWARMVYTLRFFGVGSRVCLVASVNRATMREGSPIHYASRPPQLLPRRDVAPPTQTRVMLTSKLPSCGNDMYDMAVTHGKRNVHNSFIIGHSFMKRSSMN